MKGETRKIHVIGINSFEFCEMPLSLQNLFLRIRNIAVPISYADNIKPWFEKDQSQNKNFFISRSDNNLIQWIKDTSEDLILVSRGDPLWYGIGRILLENFSKKELYFYPSNSCIQLAFSKLKRPWHNVEIISIHGRDSIVLTKALKSRRSSIAVITDSKKSSLEIIKNNLVELNLENIYEFFLCEELGFQEEKITTINVKRNLPKEVSALNIVVLLKRKENISKFNYPLFGLTDSLYKTFPDRPNLITKREIRIQILADLELPENGIIWDIGAGSGTIGLEALRIRPNLKLFSIDKRLGTKQIISDNAKLLNVSPENIFEDDIKKILPYKLNRSLEPPSRIIIGGCNRKTKIFVIDELSRFLSSGAILVLPVISYEVLQETKQFLEDLDFKVYLNLIQTYKGLSISEGTRFEPNNPVFILKAKKL